MKIFLSALLVLTASCSFKKTSNQSLKGHEQLYSEPEAPKLSKLEPTEKRIVIASTNDLHGNINPEPISFTDEHNKENQSIQIGGEKIIGNYFKVLRDTYQNVILLDSGDIFSNGKDLSPIVNYYSEMKYDAVTVGLRDFNLKVPSKVSNSSQLFQNFAKKSKVPLLLSNLYELKTARVVEWEGTKPYVIKEVDGVKVGIIGLIPDDIVAQTPVDNRVGLFVENMLQSTLRHARLLRSLGADMIVVLTHQGIDCNSELASEKKLPLGKVNFEPQRENICDLKSVLGEYLERLPPQLVDVVIGGRNHQKMANFVNGTLVMGGYPDGKSFNYAEFVIDTKTKKIVADKTVVHQPVYFCAEFFKETNDCFYEDKSVNHKNRKPVSFLGHEFDKDKLAINEFQTRSPVLVPSLKEISKSLNTFDADISYVPEGSGETQLFVMAITGRDLARILEEDYNHSRKDYWQPSPYLFKGEDLTVSITGKELDVNKVYKVLTDLESIQKRKAFIQQIGNYEAKALMNHSWSSLEEDTVSSQLAAQTR